MRIVFFGPDQQRTQQWIDCLRQQELIFDAYMWQQHDATSTIQADYAVVWTPPEAFFTSVVGLKAVFNVGAGVDAILRLRSLPRSLDVIRLDDKEIGQKMSEYALHAVVEITRQMGEYRQSNIDKQWDPAPYTYFDDWPIGIMGLGKIGRQIADVLIAVGYPVNGWSRSPRHVAGVTTFHDKSTLGQFLKASRIVLNVLPLTSETENILDADALDHMPQGSFLINIGRGEHLDEEALLRSIGKGILSGAILDVFREEPLPVDHPFWDEPKIRITPHVSGATNVRLAMRQIGEKIQAHRNGESLSGVIDKQAGY